MSESDTKSLSFGPIQIITKSLLIIAGLSILLRNVRDHFLILNPGFYTTADKLSKIYDISAGVIFLCLVGFFMIINNDWLVRRILPAEGTIPVEQQKLWLAASLRILFTLYGIFLISHLVGTVVYIIVCFAGWLRLWFDGILWSSLFADRNLSIFWVRLYSLSVGILGVYLLLGAPGIVRWQMKKVLNLK